MGTGNDSNNGQPTSLVVFTATSGRQYQIAVDGYYGASGNITLSLTQPGLVTKNQKTPSRCREGVEEFRLD